MDFLPPAPKLLLCSCLGGDKYELHQQESLQEVCGG